VKIVFLTRSLNYGGAERQLVALAKGLKHRGHTVVIAVFYSGGPLEEGLREAGVTVRPLNKKGRWDTFGFLLRLINLVKQEMPDALHGYLCVPNILATLISPLFPGLRIAWGVRASNMDLKRYDWTRKALYGLECWLARFADLIVVNSQAGMRYAIANGFPESKMIVISNGIDTDCFRADKDLRQQVRTELGVAANQKLIGIIGRLDPMKGHATFLKAAAMLTEQHKDLLFLCVGNGTEDYRDKMINVSKEFGLTEHMIWSKARSDMPAVYNAMDIIVSASSYGEGFSNVIGEAMACGVPCVVTDVGDSAFIVGDGGEVVPPSNAEALKAAIARLADKIGAGHCDHFGNRQRIVDQFSVIEMQSKTEAALLRLVKATC